MTERSDLESTDLTERVVLFELAERDGDDDTPASALDLLDGCRSRVRALDGVTGGKLTEADLVRACRSLAATDLVRERPAPETSPVGKGRPAFDLAVEAATVREFVRDDDRLAGVTDEAS